MEQMIASCSVSGRAYHRKSNGLMKVYGTLRYIRGNQKPHFSLTGVVHRVGFPDQHWLSGACHEAILKEFPRFADFAALHLSDMDGSPLHATKNGLYKIAGALGGLGEKYHLGNQRMLFSDGYREPTPDECREMARKHFRCTDEQLDHLIEELRRSDDCLGTVEAFCQTLKSQWKAEADAIIEKYKLEVSGDVDDWEKRQLASPAETGAVQSG